MASRPQGVKSYNAVGTGLADAVVKAANGILYSVNISFTGATADDLIHVHNCAAVADITVANRIFSYRIPAAVGDFAASLPVVGIEADTGLVLNIQASGANWAISVGYD